MEDNDIIDGLKSGDNDAYKVLYARHYNTLCKYAYKVVADSYAARSIVNDVIFSLWRNRYTLEIQHLRSYLLRAVRNRCLNFLIEEKRRNNLHPNLPENQDLLFESTSTHTDDTPMDYLLAKELDVKIIASIAGMPAQTRQIFLLSRSGNLKYHEIAKELNISVDVVKYHIKQALQSLRKDLQEYFFKESSH